MAKFKIGDKAILKNPDRNIPGWHWGIGVKQFDSLIGKIVTIRTVGPQCKDWSPYTCTGYTLLESPGLFWPECLLEPIKMEYIDGF